MHNNEDVDNIEVVSSMLGRFGCCIGIIPGLRRVGLYRQGIKHLNQCEPCQAVDHNLPRCRKASALTLEEGDGSRTMQMSQMIHLSDDTRAVPEEIPTTLIQSSCKRGSDFIEISASVHTWSATSQVYFQSSAVVPELMRASLSEET
ncbi:hypothetical protein GJ744_000753 [Endocarpon pusillum]|uniref:Uncharacterized protein n=1 Tax=Endocarpon pusillum TaxID=364733 RepID=A0A8H7AE87_9EURO|nr:hypothetical protein GJ744_000753 [Endocarpon pusillum]